VEGDGLGLDLALLHIDLVSGKDDRDVLTHTDKVTCDIKKRLAVRLWSMGRQKLTVPVGNVLVGDAGSNIKHDDTALAVDVVPITETTEFLLTGSIPHIELKLAKVGVETERAVKRSAPDRVDRDTKTNVLNLDTQRGDVLLLKLSGQMTLDEGGLRWQE
jgi:hypothetical protein